MQKSIRVKVEHDQVLLICNGVLLAELPAQAAADVASALAGAAKLAEGREPGVIERQVQDQALMLRTGFMPGLALSSEKAVLAEAKKEAQWNRELRKSVRASDKADLKVKYGVPEVRKKPPAQTLSPQGVKSSTKFGSF